MTHGLKNNNHGDVSWLSLWRYRNELSLILNVPFPHPELRNNQPVFIAN
jgi:hypothetical protein